MKSLLTCMAVSACLICASEAAGQSKRIYVLPEADMGMFEIGPIQIDLTKRHDPQVVVQWRMVRPGIKGSPAVIAVTGDRTFTLLLTGVGNKPAGTLRFDYEGPAQKPASAAVWIEVPQNRAATCLVSNVSTLGIVDPERIPKFAAPQEAADFEGAIVKRLPPKEVPAGHIALTNAHRIVPGMPIKAAYENEWFDAEVLAIDSRGWVTARYDDPQKSMRMLPTFHAKESSWFAAEPKVIAMAQSNPRRFRPSASVLPGTISIIPDGYVALPTIDLPPGFPVKFASVNTWRDGFVLKNGAGHVEVQSSFGGRLRTKTVSRGEIIATKMDARRAANPNSKRLYADNLLEQPAAD